MNFEMKELPRQHSDRVRDQRIERVVELVSPAEMLEDLPLGEKREDAVLAHRAEVTSVLDREDDRLLVVVGPCSVHDPEAALDYARRLGERAAELRDDLCVAMRVYFEKPRTTTGWKGLINDPHLDGSRRRQRRAALGAQPAARGDRPRTARSAASSSTRSRRSTSPTWSPGARSALARPRARSTASSRSGLSMPVGFKNGTDGNVKVAVDAVRAAAAPHAFAGVDVERHAGDPLHRGQSRLPRDPARRKRRAQLRRPPRSARRSNSCAPPACRSGS